MKIYDKLYVNGKWISSSKQEVISVVNPFTEEICGQVPEGTREDVDRAVNAARTAFNSWSKTKAKERSELIHRISVKLEERKTEIGQTISHEMGMPVKLSIAVQVGLSIRVMSSYAEYASEVERVEQVENSLIMREPIGVCGLITPWNYPLHQIIGKVAPALASGCTMVVKPSKEAPLNAFILAEIMDEVGMPAGVFNLVSGSGHIVGEALCSNEDVDMISFTGSTGAGKRISMAAAQTIKRVTLELGGKSANVILDDANFEKAVKSGVKDILLNSGQTCIALSRMLVPFNRHEEVVEIVKRTVGKIVMGDPNDPTVFMGPVISHSHRETVLEYIAKGIKEGAVLLTGGIERPSGFNKGYFVKPTVFVNVSNSMTIAREEIFGPVLCIMPYKDEDEAIQMANDSVYGLSGAVWSGDVDRAERFARRMRTGQVYINGSGFNIRAPFGGYKQSGNGRELGKTGLEEFLETKSIQI